MKKTIERILSIILVSSLAGILLFSCASSKAISNEIEKNITNSRGIDSESITAGGTLWKQDDTNQPAEKRIIIDGISTDLIKEELRILLGNGRIILDIAEAGQKASEIDVEILSVPAFSSIGQDDIKVLSENEICIPIDSAGKYLFRVFSDREIELTVYKRKSLAVVLDGVRADALINLEPGIFQDLVQGTWQENYRTAYSLKTQPDPYTNPNSGPNHASIMTGVSSRKHGVYTNSQYKAGMADIESYPHYLDILEMDNSSVHTAFLVEWDSSNSMIQNPDYWHTGQWEYQNSPEIGDDVLSHSDLIAAETNAILSGMEIDIPGMNGKSWTGGDVDALFIFFDLPDKAGHGLTSLLGIFDNRGFYPYSDAYIESVEICTNYIQSFLDTIAARPDFAYEEWQFVFTTDHGGFLTSHGYYNASCTSIWFLNTENDIDGGEIDGSSFNRDLAPTVLDHFGFDTDRMRESGLLDGRSLPGDNGTISELPIPVSHEVSSDQTFLSDFDDDGFTITLQYTHPFFDNLRNRRLIIGTPLEQLDEGLGFGIYTDFEFWTAIGGRWGNSDGSITPDVRETDTNQSLGVIAAGENGAANVEASANAADAGADNNGNVTVSDRVEIYSLMPEAGRQSFMAVSVDGTGTITLYSDRSEGYLNFVTGNLPTSMVGEKLSIPLVTGEFVEHVRIWDRELTAWELKKLYDSGQLD